MNEPLLMQNQEGALNQDTFAQQEFINLKNKFGLKYAIETGTCLGYTTDFLCDNYEKVHTIEINENYLNFALKNRLNKRDNVLVYIGSSADTLLKMIKDLPEQENIFIFLDAHWGQHCPLKDELRQIKESGIKPVIAIHDFLVPNKPNLGFDSINGQPFTYEWLKNDFDAIYGETGYEYYYNSESTGANRGIIYLTPKNN